MFNTLLSFRYFNPDILTIQESHDKFNKVIMGKPKGTLFRDNFKYSLVSYNNSIYVYNKNISLAKQTIQDRHIRMTVSTPNKTGNARNLQSVPYNSITLCSRSTSKTEMPLYKLLRIRVKPSQISTSILADHNEEDQSSMVNTDCSGIKPRNIGYSER